MKGEVKKKKEIGSKWDQSQGEYTQCRLEKLVKTGQSLTKTDGEQ